MTEILNSKVCLTNKTNSEGSFVYCTKKKINLSPSGTQHKATFKS